ncbi:MAG: serine/threonine protein kinase [Acidobacteria bacterium]|nr:serine/threonine protein kinase [Acidobacteriota bacterium]
MIRCAACGTEQPATQAFCGVCGARLVEAAGEPTRTVAVAPLGPGATGATASPPGAGARFLPGSLLGRRYRVAGLLGRGGMGEVYRADDLKLGQPVALKLLPPEVAQEPTRLARLLNEVRVALRVTHPNVCRVFDVGEADGQQYIAMEYIDGEDLSSLLRRIGHLPRAKAIQIARQLCAGLAAAHEQGIVHRDLKPANVMIDGRGQARLTDFGIASAAEVFAGDEASVGTPAYMAPEQLEGRGATIQSDLFALGLVLHELFTGRRVQRSGPGGLSAGLRREGGAQAVREDDLDPAIAGVIERCLDPDPERRPVSALAVAAALPGLDPLAAALAEGETPSPQVVADAPSEGTLRPALAALLFTAALASIFFGLATLTGDRLVSRVPLERVPAAQIDRARENLAAAGYPGPAADSAFGFGHEPDALVWARAAAPRPLDQDAMARDRPRLVVFWYRQSPIPLVPRGDGALGVTFGEPPSIVPGMMRLATDARGRLIEFEVTSPVESAASPSGTGSRAAPDPSWEDFFRRAGLDLGAFAPVETSWIPRVPFDRRAGWEGPDPEHPSETLRVQAASFAGRPVAFRVEGPWRADEAALAGSRLQAAVFALLLLVAAVGAALLARRSLRLGRGDAKGATRVAVAFVVVELVAQGLRAHHVADPAAEYESFVRAAGPALLYACLIWLAYVAFEPFVRRRWPHALISWSRALDGRWRDPLVGQHVLLGCLTAGLMLLARSVVSLAMGAAGIDPPPPSPHGFPALQGWNWQVAGLLTGVWRALRDALGGLLLLVVLRLVLRSTVLAAALVVVAATVVFSWWNPGDAAATGLVTVLWLVVTIRYGLLPGVVALAVFYFGVFAAGSSHLGAWHGAGTLLAAAAATGLAGWGYFAALGGRPLIRDEALD